MIEKKVGRLVVTNRGGAMEAGGNSSISEKEPIEAAQEHTVDLEARMNTIHGAVASELRTAGLPQETIDSGDIRLPSIVYMMYWYRRLRNNPEEQAAIRHHLTEYIGTSVPDSTALVDRLCQDHQFDGAAVEYVDTIMTPTPTVDLLVMREGAESSGSKDVLCISRKYYPDGPALPGGIIKETDEDNPLGIAAKTYAALRVAGKKILGVTGEQAHFSEETDARGKKCFVVRGAEETPAVRIYPEDEGGYHIHENPKSVLRPSDPRHIVDTTGLRCELIGDVPENLQWRSKSEIMSPDSSTGGFAFGHHREIVAHITAQTSVEKERQMQEREFVRGLIQNPLESYKSLKERFEAEGNTPEVLMPELFPVVDKLIQEAFSDEINQMCEETPLLAGIRDKAIISLRHVSMKNRKFCPYLPTVRAIAEAVAFFDVVARQKKDFYSDMPKDRIVEHNPAETPYASYHMYRYKYRMDEMMNMVPNEIIVPTFEHLSATDLMRVRGVPVRFIGISTDFLYVDEFEQSPEEFFMHDCNHSWRMIMEDRAAEKKYGRTQEELVEESNEFLLNYLAHIKIRKGDTKEQREIKKLKKIILFEIVHEDARPFLKDVICEYLQVKEGGAVPFEVPRIDPDTGYMDMVDTLDTGISTLSYVRNKLQHGFYDHIDAQLPQIVGPKFRSAEWISRAAYEMLAELGATPRPDAELDVHGKVSYEWLLKRTCAVGPDNIHGTDAVDPAVEEFGDGADRLNPKRYQA